MFVIHTCPECGGDLEHLVYTTYPPVYVWSCTKCSWKYEEREKIKRVPFVVPESDESDVVDVLESVCY